MVEEEEEGAAEFAEGAWSGRTADKAVVEEFVGRRKTDAAACEAEEAGPVDDGWSGGL